MNDSATMHTGPLGSAIHVLRADAGTIAELAAIDWSRHFRRVRLDPVRGLITLMSPSHLHEDLADIFDDIVDVAGSTLGGAVKGLRSTRLRGHGEPPGTGMEPDCAFYLGERAREFRDVLVEGEAEAVAFIERVAPDLVVEVEITHADAGKVERYGEMGGAGAVAAPRAQGYAGAPGRLPRAAPRQRTARARRLGAAGRTHSGRRVRSRGRGAFQPDPRRTNGGRGPHRTAAATRERAGARGRRPAVLRGRRRSARGPRLREAHGSS